MYQALMEMVNSPKDYGVILIQPIIAGAMKPRGKIMFTSPKEEFITAVSNFLDGCWLLG